MTNDNVAPSFDPFIEDHLSENLRESNLKAVGDIIDSHNSPDSQNILDILSWLLRQLGDSSATHPPEFKYFAKLKIQSLSQYVTAKEFLLIILGEIEFSQSLHLLSFSMSFVESCALSIGLSSITNIQTIFTVIRTKIHNFLLMKHRSCSFKMDSVFVTLLMNLGNMLMALFSQDCDKECLEAYTADVLYHFAEPLQFLDFNDGTIPIFKSFLSVLRKVTPSVYTACYEPYHLSYISSDIDSYLPEFTDNSAALLFVWNSCLSNKIFHSFIPFVFTTLYKYEVLVYMSIPFVQKLTNKLAQGSPLSPVEIKQLIRVQEGLMINSTVLKECYPSTWWRQPVISLVKNLQAICKYPVMGSKLPVEIKNCVFSIESLLSRATITACCELYAEIIDQSAKSFHNGFRSHMIVSFRNFLHRTLTNWKEVKVSTEEKLGESRVILPYYPDYLRRMFNLIFVHPLPGCNEDLINQSGWLNASLNFAIYILSRCSGIKGGDFDEQLKTIMNDVALALSRPDDKGRSALEFKFLEPLNNDIIMISNKYKRANAEYENNPDPSVIAPNAPSHKQCQLILTDLRLLMTNLSYVKDLLCR